MTVCEARPVVGGAAVTEEFHPGFRNSVASYTVSLLNPQVIADMGLHGHGLRIVERPISNFLPVGDTTYLKLGGGLERTRAEFVKFSKRDAEALPAYYALLDEIGDVLRSLAQQTPPNLGDGLPGLMRALRQCGRSPALWYAHPPRRSPDHAGRWDLPRRQPLRALRTACRRR